MTFIEPFHFIRPLWLLALLPLALVLVLLWLRQRKDSAWTQWVSPQLLPFLLDGQQFKQSKLPLLAIASLWLIACLSLAGPAWQQLPQPVQKNAEALVICWDISPSMLAEDIKPSRLERSRLKLIDLLKQRTDGVTALVAYAGEAYTVAPLTDDVNTLINLLPALSPTTLPSVGSNPEMAMEMAIELLKDAGIVEGNILYLTDGIDPAAYDTLDSFAASVPHNVTYWGVGTEDGAPIPLPNGGFAKENGGNIVIARFDEQGLRNFAARSGHFYVPLTSNDSDIQALETLLAMDVDNTKKTDRVFDRWFEHGQYLCLFLIPMLLPFFRRGWVFLLLLAPAFLFSAPKAQAFSWQDLWFNENQQAQQALEKGNQEAADQFTTPELRGSANYELENYDKAANNFSKGSSALHDYNLGTALTRQGKYEEAIKAFDQALSKNPELNMAQENKAIAEKLAAMQKEQQQQQNQQGQSGDQQQNQQDDGQQQQGEQNEQQNGGQQGDQNSSQANQQAQNNEQSQNQDGQQSDDQNSENQQASADQDSEADQSEKANPYTQAGEEQETQDEKTAEQNSAELAEQQAAEEKSKEEAESQQQMLANMQQGEPQTEEEQKLQQWLRKVPDDPSGLMRNKFKHQYLERRRSIEGSYNEAEKRW